MPKEAGGEAFQISDSQCSKTNRPRTCPSAFQEHLPRWCVLPNNRKTLANSSLDLTDSNVVFELSDFKSWTEAQIYEYLGVPRTAPLHLHDGSRPGNCAPSVVVESIQYTNIDERWFSGRIRIIDFGEAFHADRPPDVLNTQASFLAPEVLFGQKPSTASDIWALGCLIFELEASKPLFPVFFGAPVEAVTRIVQTTGALPKEWHHSYYDDVIGAQLRAVENHWWFDSHKERRYALESQISSIEPKLTLDETTNFISLLRGALAFDTDQRPSAQEIEMHEWFNSIR
jgi:serine/threonine-protein kinase SRPK3